MDNFDLMRITVGPFSTSSLHTTFLMEFNNHFFEIGKDAAELLNYLKENGCDEVAVDTYVESHDGHPSKDDVIEFLEMLSSKIAEGKVSSTKKGVFLYRHDLISSEKVRKCASSLKILFDSRVMMAIVGIFIILDFIHFTEFYTETIHVDLSIYTVIGLFLFFIFSSLIHELGHASACHYFQIPHGNIGFGLYLNIPVFYTDVSQAWKLTRRERFLINIGGVYFQMVLLIPFLIAYFFFHYPFFKYIIVVMNMNFVITLNPFFKFDGYWILSDVLGVANLRKKGTEWVGYVLSKIKNKKVEHRPYLFALSRGAKSGLVVYTVVVNLFFGFYFFYVLPLFFVRFYKTFPDRFSLLIRELSYRQTPDWSNVQQIVLQLLFLVLAFYMLYRIIYPFYKKIRVYKES